MKNILKDLCATFLSIILFMCIIFLSSILIFHNITTKENIKQIIKNTDFHTEIKNQTETKQTNGLFHDIYITAEKYHIPEQFIDKVLNDKTTKDFLSTIAANVIEETLTGKDGKILTANDLNQLLENNIDHFQEVSHIQLSQEQEQNFLSLAKEHSTTIIEILPTTEELQSYLSPSMIDSIQLLNSNSLIYIFIGIIIISSILILLLKWKEKTWLLYLATPLFFSSIVLVMLAYASPTILSILLQSSNDLLYLFVEQLALHLKEDLTTIGVILFICSIFIYIIYFINKKLILKKSLSSKQ